MAIAAARSTGVARCASTTVCSGWCASPCPFIIANFIEGESLGALLKDLPESQMLRSDVADEDLDTIYRQIANFLLDLSKLNFPRIGSLSETSDSSHGVMIDSRPVTLRAHEILSHGGVDVNCMSNLILLLDRFQSHHF
jgi:hypothetical protein